MSRIRVGVFPLRNIILYPHTHLPLVVQDPGYVQMILDSERLNFPIALGLGDTVKDTHGRVLPRLLRPKKIIGLGKVEVIEKYEDGSVFVIFHGFAKCSLHDVYQHMPYLVCDAEIINDLDGHQITRFPQGTLTRLSKLLGRWLRENIEDEIYLQAVLSELTQLDQIVSHIAAFMVKDRELKQILLETYSLGERVQIIDALFPANFMDNGEENHQLRRALKSFENGDFLLAGNEH